MFRSTMFRGWSFTPRPTPSLRPRLATGPMGRTRSSGLELSVNRQETYFHALVHRRRDPPQHGHRVTFIVRIFKPGNDRRGSANQTGKLLLGEAGPLAKIVNFARHFGIGTGLLQCGQPLPASGVKALVQDLDSVAGSSIFFFHE